MNPLLAPTTADRHTAARERHHRSHTLLPTSPHTRRAAYAAGKCGQRNSLSGEGQPAPHSSSGAHSVDRDGRRGPFAELVERLQDSLTRQVAGRVKVSSARPRAGLSYTRRSAGAADLDLAADLSVWVSARDRRDERVPRLDRRHPRAPHLRDGMLTRPAGAEETNDEAIGTRSRAGEGKGDDRSLPPIRLASYFLITSSPLVEPDTFVVEKS